MLRLQGLFAAAQGCAERMAALRVGAADERAEDWGDVLGDVGVPLTSVDVVEDPEGPGRGAQIQGFDPAEGPCDRVRAQTHERPRAAGEPPREPAGALDRATPRLHRYTGAIRATTQSTSFCRAVSAAASSLRKECREPARVGARIDQGDLADHRRPVLAFAGGLTQGVGLHRFG